MDFGQIIKRAWELTKHNRFLWWLGILAFFTEGASSFSSSVPRSIPAFTDHTEQSISSLLPRATADSVSLEPVAKTTADSVTNSLFSSPENILRVVIIAAVIISLFLILIYLSCSAKAGLILSTNELEEKNKALGFAKAFHQGKQFVWRLFGMGLFVALMMLFVITCVTIPLIILYVVGHNSTSMMITLVLAVILFVILFIMIAIYLGVLMKFAERVLVLQDYGILKSLHTAHHIMRLELGNALLTYLISIALSLLTGVVLFFGLFIAGAILFGIGALIYFLVHTAGAVIYGIIVGLAFLTALFIVNGLITAFISSYWTLSYRTLDYLSAHKLTSHHQPT